MPIGLIPNFIGLGNKTDEFPNWPKDVICTEGFSTQTKFGQVAHTDAHPSTH